jgi:hypothetical protein
MGPQQNEAVATKANGHMRLCPKFNVQIKLKRMKENH